MIIKSFLKALLLTLSLLIISCSGNDYTKPRNVEEFAKKVIEYTLRIDVDGEKSLLSPKCKLIMEWGFYPSRVFRRQLTDSYKSKYNISFLEKDAHDFSKIECKLKKKYGHIILVYCSGLYELKDDDGKVVMVRKISTDVPLDVVQGELFYQPPVCAEEPVSGKYQLHSFKL